MKKVTPIGRVGTPLYVLGLAVAILADSGCGRTLVEQRWVRRQVTAAFSMEIPENAKIVLNDAPDFISASVLRADLSLTMGFGKYGGMPSARIVAAPTIEIDGMPAHLYTSTTDGQWVAVAWMKNVGDNVHGFEAKADCKSDLARRDAVRMLKSVRFTPPLRRWPPPPPRPPDVGP